jgi:transcriptional regulator with AAA-type ATPase domain
VVVYSTDHEHGTAADRRLVELAEGADVLIYDAMYTPEEYRGETGSSRVGWGHSTYEEGARVARTAGVKQLVLFHHDPSRTDDQVDALVARARALFPSTIAAREGLRLLPSAGDASEPRAARTSRVNRMEASRLRAHVSALVAGRSVCGAGPADRPRHAPRGGGHAHRRGPARRARHHLDRGPGRGRPGLAGGRAARGGAAGAAARRGALGARGPDGERLLIPDVTRDARFDKRTDQQTGWTTRSMLVVPIREQPDQPIRGVLQVLNKVSGTFVQEDLDYVTALGRQLALVFSLTSLHAERRTQPGLTLRGRFNKVIGRSPAMDAVYQRIMLAAETDATVLLQGETGTGKGVFARAIHDNSKRQAGPLVVLDATTLPAQLIESELFGHERGAFTGADRRVLGKVELAQGGTLLIDEIGDLPLESQGKLLRLLQDREFERVGGRETIASSARVVCATHRDLERMVAEGRFRQDLLYRVKVVQIAIPPLRERGAAEIALLAAHFGRMYAERYGRPQPEWTPRVLDSLAAHAWPGNVRELEHWVESAVVLCPGGQVQPFEPHASTPPMPREGSSTPEASPWG